MCCYFKDGGPHEGPIGEVRNILGKKKAKEECARLVLLYLQVVKEQRLEYARGMMAGMKGNTQVIADRAVGKEVEGEAEVATMTTGVGGQDGDSGDEGFESAVEEMD